MTIFERLKAVRKALHKDQKEMAKALGYGGSPGYSTLEKGKIKDFPEAKLLLLSNLGVNIDWMRTEEGPMFIDKSSIIEEEYYFREPMPPSYSKDISSLIEQNKLLVKQVSDLIQMQMLNAETIRNLSYGKSEKVNST